MNISLASLNKWFQTHWKAGKVQSSEYTDSDKAWLATQGINVLDEPPSDSLHIKVSAKAWAREHFDGPFNGNTVADAVSKANRRLAAFTKAKLWDQLEKLVTNSGGSNLPIVLLYYPGKGYKCVPMVVPTNREEFLFPYCPTLADAVFNQGLPKEQIEPADESEFPFTAQW